MGSFTLPSRSLVFLSLLIVCFLVQYKLRSTLPSQSLRSSANTGGAFDVNNARQHLNALTSIGPRLAGTVENEIIATRMLIKRLTDIARLAPKSVSIEIEEQHPSSHFYLAFLDGLINVYDKVSNVVIRISWLEFDKEQLFSDAILVNAHFDSAPGSPGASDDGIGVGVTIELLRALSSGQKLFRPVILLLNGAEESHHTAAHGFITKHRWAPSVRYLINLEAVGSGPREMVFQCNSGWLAAVYGRFSPYLYVSVVRRSSSG